MPTYVYCGQFYTRQYSTFSFEIEANSKEDANVKAEEYFKNEMNHENIIEDSEENYEVLRMHDLKSYFQENAEVESAFRQDEESVKEDEEFDIWMSLEK